MEQVKLLNSSGMEVLLSNVGARVTSIQLLRQGKPLEMLLVPSTEALSSDEPFYLGATCGPVCNRISQASFELNGVHYQLSNNDAEHCLHGGRGDLSMQVWDIIEQSHNRVVFAIELAHLADGFPGNRQLQVGYHLTECNSLDISLGGVTDRATPLNLTNHAYFNLGDDNTQALQFKLSTEALLERDAKGIPTGRVINIEETGFKLDNWLSIGEFVSDNQYSQIITEQGVDHCFIIAPNKGANAQLRSVKTGVCLSVYSDQPAIQFYTGKWLTSPYEPYQGICLEAQGLTDAVNHCHFPSVIVDSGASYHRFIRYQFTFFDS